MRALLFVLLAGLSFGRAHADTIGGCKFFPSGSFYAPYNTKVTSYPLNPNSANYIATYPTTLYANFGYNALAGMPFNVVPATQPLVPITFTKYPWASDPGPYPIPANPIIEGQSGGGDHHLIVLYDSEGDPQKPITKLKMPIDESR
jgi:hypothetical protein